MIDRMPPQDIEVEANILGRSMLNKSACLMTIEKLQEDDFYLENHRILFRAIKHLTENDKPVERLSVSIRLKEMEQLEKIGGDLSLIEIMQQTELSVDHYINVVKDFSIRRDTINLLTDNIERLYSDISTEEIVNSINASLLNLETTEDEPCETQDLDSLEKLREIGNSIPTGFAMDKSLHGLFDGNLIIIAARPSVGKTSLALNMSENIGRGDRVLFNSAEMMKEELKLRMLSNFTQIAYMKLLKADLNLVELAKVKEAEELISSLDIVINDNVDNIDNMIITTHRLHQKKPIRCIFTDYAQLLSSSVPGSKNEKVSDISKKCKQLAKKLKCPHVLLSQFSRGVEKDNRLPQLSDLRDSGSLEQDADVVVFLVNPIFENDDDYELWKEQDKQEKDLIIAKGRNSRLGSAKIIFNKKYTLFED